MRSRHEQFSGELIRFALGFDRVGLLVSVVSFERQTITFRPHDHRVRSGTPASGWDGPAQLISQEPLHSSPQTVLAL
jgi:hypothetical protein